MDQWLGNLMSMEQVDPFKRSGLENAPLGLILHYEALRRVRDTFQAHRDAHMRLIWPREIVKPFVEGIFDSIRWQDMLWKLVERMGEEGARRVIGLQ